MHMKKIQDYVLMAQILERCGDVRLLISQDVANFGTPRQPLDKIIQFQRGLHGPDYTHGSK